MEIKKIIKSCNRTIVLRNQYNQLFLISQAEQTINIYRLEEGVQLRLLNCIKGILYDEMPLEIKRYYKSKVHTIDQKNNRLIILIYEKKDKLITWGIKRNYTIVCLDYEGQVLYTIPIQIKSDRIYSLDFFNNGDIMVFGKSFFDALKYTDNIPSEDMMLQYRQLFLDEFQYVMRINTQGIPKWVCKRRIQKKLSEGEMFPDLHLAGSWIEAYVIDDNRIMLEVWGDKMKKRIAFMKINGKFFKNKSMIEVKEMPRDSLIRKKEDIIVINKTIDLGIDRTGFERSEYDLQGKIKEMKILQLSYRASVFEFTEYGVFVVNRNKAWVEYRSFKNRKQLKIIPVNNVELISGLQYISQENKELLLIFYCGEGFSEKRYVIIIGDNNEHLKIDYENGYVEIVICNNQMFYVWNSDTFLGGSELREIKFS